MNTKECHCHENASKFQFPKEIDDYIQECQTKPHPESYLINVLHKAQNHFGYLSPECLENISQKMGIPSSTICGVASFYHLFSFRPRGKYRIAVCMGTACYVKGSGMVLEKLKELLEVKEGDTTPDGNFSIECGRCFGACALAPVVIINEKVYGEVRPDQVVKILSEYGFQKS